jgi:uncharacterized protein YecE (DUF72 family)
MHRMQALRIGTSAFTAAGWPGSFYPKGLAERDYLSYYATRFDTVEVDSTFYRCPPLSTVQGWNAKTPPHFIFAAKVPQSITHEKMLRDCDAELNQFLRTMDALGEKLGPLLFQFGYFNKKAFAGVGDFLARLVPFLKKLPRDRRFAVEIRNKNWLVPAFIDALREHGVSLALIDQSWMQRPWELPATLDPFTAGFVYARLLGDRKGIEQQTKSWDKVIVDRNRELAEWAKLCRPILHRGTPLFVYVNNHYAGHAPATADQLLQMLSPPGAAFVAEAFRPPSSRSARPAAPKEPKNKKLPPRTGSLFD